MTKPKILFISDTKWAWYYKSLQLKKYLSDEFDIDIICLLDGDKIDPDKYDLYFTYGYSYVDHMVKAGVPFRKRVSGITAHRNKKAIEPQMRKAYATHANSMLLFNQLKDIHNNAFYVPNGVDEEMFKPLKPIPQYRDNIVVGNVAKMHPLKGQNDYIIPAVKRSKADYIFHHSNYSNKIKHEEMVHIYQDMDCFLIASVEDGTPNPGLEAAACGRPLISNPIGNMPEFIRDGYNGFLIPERDVNAYVEKIEWLRDHRKDMIQMGKNARSTVEREWTWRKQSENYRRMLRKCL